MYTHYDMTISLNSRTGTYRSKRLSHKIHVSTHNGKGEYKLGMSCINTGC